MCSIPVLCCLQGLKNLYTCMFLQVCFLLSREQDGPLGFLLQDLQLAPYRPLHLRPEPGRRRESASRTPPGESRSEGSSTSPAVFVEIIAASRCGADAGSVRRGKCSACAWFRFRCWNICAFHYWRGDDSRHPNSPSCSPNLQPPEVCEHLSSTAYVYFITHKFILHFYLGFV